MVTVEPKRFHKYEDKFLSQYFRDNPVNATWIGVHDYDGKWPDYHTNAIRDRLEMLKQFRSMFNSIRNEELSLDDRIDLELILNAIEKEEFNWTELKSYTWNPLMYVSTLGYGIQSLSGYDFAPAKDRAESLYTRLEEAPEFIAEAMENLGPMPKIHLKTAIKQIQGIENLVDDGLADFIVQLPEDQATKVKAAAKQAGESLAQFKEFLELREKTELFRDFRIGAHLYEKKFVLYINEDLEPEEVMARAEMALRNTQQKMFELAAPLYEQEMGQQAKANTLSDRLRVIRTVLDEIAQHHASRDSVVASVKGTIKELSDFIDENHIIDQDSTKPLIVRETPEYERGVSIASLEAPGPLEKNLQTYYNVSPIPKDWSDDQAESFLREYNTISVKILSVHEALPGHYIQLIYANRCPSLVRAVFSSGVMIEGWAHYCETMMVDEGLGHGDPRYKLVSLKWKLRGIANAIMDQKIHIEEMTKEQAMDLMVNQTFQEKSEAEGKWIRAQLTSGQLSTYFVGYSLMMDLRKQVEHKEGKDFDLENYHEALLDHGSIPVRFLKEYLLN